MSLGYPSNFDTSSMIMGSGLTMTSTFPNHIINLDLSENTEFQDLASRITQIEDMLCILKPDLEMNEKYASLKQAYEAYQIILKLVKDRSESNK